MPSYYTPTERAASSTTPAAVGTAAVGVGTTDARADHVHATGAGTPSTQAFGDAAATGTGPAAAMTDHKHAMPAAPTASSVGAVALAPSASQTITSQNAVDIPLSVKGHASQSGNLLVLENSAGTDLVVVDNAGLLGVGSGVDPLATVHVAGGSSSSSGELGTLLVTGTTTAQRLAMGVDASGTVFGWVQAVINGTAAARLHLNPISGWAGTGAVVVNSGGYIASGTGAPESVVTAPVGSIWLRTDGGSGTSAYIKESGAGNTGWAAVASAGSPPGLGLYGDGSDGAITFNGSTNPVAGATLSGSVYTMTRDIFATNITVDAGITVVGLYRMFATGTLDNNGTIHNDGGAGSGTTAGAATVQGAWSLGSVGGAGLASNTTTVAGNAGTACGSATALVAKGGTGGTGGNSNGAAGGLITALQAAATSFRSTADAATGMVMSSGNAANKGPTLAAFYGGSGGGSGGRTTGGTATTSGAGGGGGGVVLICAKTLDNGGGTIRANGGNGGNAAGGTCVTGGGGGGGGGFVVLIYDSLTAGTEQAAGGTKGTGVNAASAAADGGAGTVLKIPNA